MRLQELLLSLHLAQIDVLRIPSPSKHSSLSRMELVLVHCCVIYNVTTIVIMLNLVMVGVEVATILWNSSKI